MQETRVRYLGQEDPLEKETATHSSILAWRIPWTEEPGRLQPMWLQESDTTEWLSLLLYYLVHAQGCLDSIIIFIKNVPNTDKEIKMVYSCQVSSFFNH